MRSFSARRLAVTPAAALLALAAASSTSLAAAETFAVDPVHSSVMFRVSHVGVGRFHGRFNDPSGSVTVDDADPTKSKFDVSVRVDKIDTANAKRDEHLKSPDFFSAKDYPTIAFKSTSVKKGDGDTLEVSGDLTLHGTTKPVTVTVERFGTADTPMGRRAGFETTFTVKRSEYGMTGYLDKGIGDEVRLTVAIEGVVKK